MKNLVALILITSIALAAVSVNDAQDIVRPFVYQGEQIDIQPQTKTFSGANSYWVMEAKSLSQIQVMFPVDTDTGSIVRSETIKSTLKTHYLANFFTTSNSISNFLDETLTYTQQQQADLDQKIRNFETNIETFISSDLTFTKKDSYKTAVSDAIDKSTTLRSTITSLKAKISGIDDPTDITSSQSLFNSFFTQETALLDSLDNVVTKSDEFHLETNQKINSGELDTSFGNTMIISTTHSISTIQRKDSLTTNKNTIDGLFSSLDSKADDFFVKLNNRVSQSQEEIERRAIIEDLNNYSSEYASLNDQGTSMTSNYRQSSGFDSDLNQLYALLNDSYAYCSGTLAECMNAEDNYAEMDSLIASLDADIAGYSITCVTGQTRSCTAGGQSGTQTCTSGSWTACVPTSEDFDYTLIGALVFVILVLIAYKYKDKFIGGEKVEPKKKDYLSYYKR
jgi:hypothetical protein